MNYVKTGKVVKTVNDAYVTGGIGIVVPYNKNKVEHNITYRTNYYTDYARFFHSYNFKKYCEHFNLSAKLIDYRNKVSNKYVLKWEMFTPNLEYGFNSKRKIFQADTEIIFSPVEWMMPGCGYIITINHVK